MSEVDAIAQVTRGLATLLKSGYPDELKADPFKCEFEPISSTGFKKDVPPGNRVTIYLHRVSFDPHARNQGLRDDRGAPDPPLSLDLHYLVSVWSDNADVEQTIFAWVLHELHRRPVLDLSVLPLRSGVFPNAAAFTSEDVVQLIPAELSTEDLMRIWDALEAPYRLSFSYVARVVRIGASAPTKRVVTRDFRMQVPPEPGPPAGADA